MQIELPLNKEVYTQTMLMARPQKQLNSLMRIFGDTMTKSGKNGYVNNPYKSGL